MCAFVDHHQPAQWKSKPKTHKTNTSNITKKLQIRRFISQITIIFIILIKLFKLSWVSSALHQELSLWLAGFLANKEGRGFLVETIREINGFNYLLRAC